MDKPIHGEWDFKLKRAWEISQLGDHFMEKIRGIAVGNDNKLFLWQTKYLKVLVCDTKGTFLYAFAGIGEGPGEIMDKYASSLFLRDNRIIIHERNGGRVSRFLPDGTFQNSKRIKKMKYSHALKTYLDPHRFLYLENGLGIYDLDTDEIEEIVKIPEDTPLSVEHKEAGNVSLHISDISVSTVCAQSRGKKIFYGRNDLYLIKGLDLETEKSVSLSLTGRKGRHVEESALMKRLERIPIDKRLKKLLVKKCPDTTRFFNRITIDKKGLIYVFVPDWQRKSAYEIDIFSPKGDYLYHTVIKIPGDYSSIRNLTFGTDALYFTAEDKQGEGKLVKFDISSPADFR